nr:importin beta-like SAD2 isoform X2 [Ipomoea batatas]GMD90793.1 importin beta-like SAD2 isoform X2 [Ipomoea batatas]GME01854.1 importin beta-like SAD2 isoform X2 [Ipomoea batatas]
MEMKLTVLNSKNWLHRQRLSAQMMMTTMIFQMMILVRMKNWNHPLMRWILLFSSWILSKFFKHLIP